MSSMARTPPTAPGLEVGLGAEGGQELGLHGRPGQGTD